MERSALRTFPRSQAAWILARVLNDRRSLEQGIELAEISPQDRPWLMEVCSGALRWKGRVDLALDAVSHQKKPTGWMRRILWISAYQLIAQDRVSVSQVVSETVDEIKNKEGRIPSSYANAVLRKIATHALEWRQLSWNPAASLAEQAAWASLPVWFWEKLVRDHGLEWARLFAEASLARPELWVRVWDEERFRTRWGEQVQPGPIEGSFRWVERPSGSIQSWAGFLEGEFFVQDLSSQYAIQEVVQAATKIFPGKKIHALDYCSAPGGKSLGLMEAGWQVDATDESASRLGLLKENMSRISGVSQIRVIEPEARDSIDYGSYDLIWVDAPCSGSGVVRRHPDFRWSKTSEQVDLLISLQSELIQRVWSRMRPGSLLVYSVCSVFKDEGERQVSVLQGAREVAQKWVLPFSSDLPGDGFFVSILLK